MLNKSLLLENITMFKIIYMECLLYKSLGMSCGKENILEQAP